MQASIQTFGFCLLSDALPNERPPISPETIEIRTEDGVALAASVFEPEKPIGVCVMAHAMFARRSSFERPHHRGLAPFFAARGVRVVTFDFRAHGESQTPARVSYDDLVRFDLPAVVNAVKARAKKIPVVVLGHSLGGHVSLASEGAGFIRATRIVAVGANVWIPSLEQSKLRWAVKRVSSEIALRVTRRIGRFPSRALRIGSDDEPLDYMEGLFRGTRDGSWRSDDGRIDYLANLSNVTLPVLAMLSDGDRITCHPSAGERFVRQTRGDVTIERIRKSDDGSTAPGHMEMVTTEACRSAWERVVRWCVQPSNVPTIGA